MQSITSFLERFKHFKDPKKEREEIASALSGILGFEIKENNINLRKNILSINVSIGIKSEIFLKKDLILNTLNKNFPKLYLEDIR